MGHGLEKSSEALSLLNYSQTTREKKECALSWPTLSKRNIVPYKSLPDIMAGKGEGTQTFVSLHNVHGDQRIFRARLADKGELLNNCLRALHHACVLSCHFASASHSRLQVWQVCSASCYTL